MRIPPATVRWLRHTQGLIENDEGAWLATLAGDVPGSQAIVEVGSHTGLSSCWLAAGSIAGLGAHVTCIDPYPPPRPGSRDDPYDLGPEGVLARFKANVAGTTQDVPREDFGHRVTLLRSTSEQVAAIWTKPVGLLFVDAIHTDDAVSADHAAWSPHVVPGGVVAYHDYGPSYPGVMVALDRVLAGGGWEHLGTTGSLWVARRA